MPTRFQSSCNNEAATMLLDALRNADLALIDDTLKQYGDRAEKADAAIMQLLQQLSGSTIQCTWDVQDNVGQLTLKNGHDTIRFSTDQRKPFASSEIPICSNLIETRFMGVPAHPQTVLNKIASALDRHPAA